MRKFAGNAYKEELVEKRKDTVTKIKSPVYRFSMQVIKLYAFSGGLVNFLHQRR